jgi:DNA-binding NarL/FixJ family response regulator
MRELTILTITQDNEFLSVLRHRIHDQLGSGSRMIVTGTTDEACALLSTVRPQLVVVHWTGDSKRYEQLDRLLWTTTVLARRVPVLVIAERYRTDQATMMYRLGVAEYISRTHHLDHLGPVFATHLRLPLPVAQRVASTEPAGQPGKAWSTAKNKGGSVTSQAV